MSKNTVYQEFCRLAIGERSSNVQRAPRFLNVQTFQTPALSGAHILRLMNALGP